MLRQGVLRFLTALLALSSSVAFAEGPAADAPARPRVLVLEPTSTVFDRSTVGTISGLMIVELAKDPKLDVISDAEVKRLAELEGDRQSAGCTDTNCLAELAGAMGARYVVFGDLGSLGSTVVLNLNLFDSQTTQAVNRVAVSADGIAALPQRLQELTAPLTGTAPVVVVPKSGPPIAPWVVAGTGAALTVGAIAADNLSPTSTNNAVDGFDFLWPATYCLVGPGLLVGGLGWLWLTPTDAKEER